MDDTPVARFRGSEIIGFENLPQPRLTDAEVEVLQLLHKGKTTIRGLVAGSSGRLTQAVARDALRALEARVLVTSEESGQRRKGPTYRVTDRGAYLAEAHDGVLEVAKALARSAARRDFEREQRDGGEAIDRLREVLARTERHKR